MKKNIKRMQLQRQSDMLMESLSQKTTPNLNFDDASRREGILIIF